MANEILITTLTAALEEARTSGSNEDIKQLEADLLVAIETAEAAEAEAEAPEVESEAPEAEAPVAEAPAAEEAERLQAFIEEARRLQDEAETEAEVEAPAAEEAPAEVEVEVEVEELSRKAAPFFRIINTVVIIIFIILIATLCSGGEGGEGGELGELEDGVYHVTCFSGDTVLFNGLSTGEDLKIKKNSLAGKFYLFWNRQLLHVKLQCRFFRETVRW